MKSLQALAAATLFTLSLGACSSMGGGQLIRDGEPTGNIQVINGSSATITAVTVSQCSAMSHGFNRLPDGRHLRPGQSHDFRVSNGCYDVMAGYAIENGHTSGSQRVNVRAGQTARVTAQ